MGVVESRHAGGPYFCPVKTLLSLCKCHPEGMNIKEQSNYQLNGQTSKQQSNPSNNEPIVQGIDLLIYSLIV